MVMDARALHFSLETGFAVAVSARNRDRDAGEDSGVRHHSAVPVVAVRVVRAANSDDSSDSEGSRHHGERQWEQ